MLKSIVCDRDTFKPINFRSGLNLVIADKTAGSARKGTRNGSGKTTLLEIIHHCLGAKPPAGNHTLAHPAVLGWKFTLTFTVTGRTLQVTRAVGSDELVVAGDTAGLGIAESGLISREHWTSLLALLMFGITKGDREDYGAPSFRDLIRYFARLGSDAMSNAFETVRKQAAQEVRFLNAFLLRLNWQLALKMKNAADRHDQLSTAKQAVEAGALDLNNLSPASLQAEEVELEAEIETATAELQSFRVHRQYAEIEREASVLTSKIQSLSQDNYADRQLLAHYEEQAVSEDSPDITLLVQLYKAAGIELGDRVIRTLEEAKAFHRQIVDDRRSFLAQERLRLKALVAEREAAIQAHSNNRAELLEILRTHGALSEYEQLVGRVDRLKERLSHVSRGRILRSDLEQKRLRSNLLIAELRLQTQQEVQDSDKHISSVQKIFGAYSKDLYGKWQHSLSITAGKKGYDFKIAATDRASSEGIVHAGIFCYDATLARIWAKESSHPGFLFHDSALFDPIEERQIEQALEAMADDSTPFQYICTLNTDRLPSAISPDHESVILKLTDRGQAGGLLGIRF